jgi:F-type H+-transporting ATPase subunit a
MSNLNISISAEPVFHLGQFVVSNSIFTSIVVTSGLILFALWFNQKLRTVSAYTKPNRFQSLIEFVIEAFAGLAETTTGNLTKARVFFPIVATFFLYIMLSNWSGLIPGVGAIGFKEASHESKTAIFVPYFRAPTADINTTLALAIFSIIYVQFIGHRFLGFHYFGKFINLKGPIDFAVGILEIFSEISRIISFAFRLFGNIFAGEVLLTVIAFLLPVIGPMPFIILEIFVGFIQALVFAMLTLVFMNVATLAHDTE